MLRSELAKCSLILAAALVSVVPANAQTCEARYAFALSGGQLACLTDFEFAKETPVGAIASIARIAPNTGTYNIAMTPRNAACPRVVGFSSTRISRPGQNNPENSTKARSMRALSDCQKALGEGPRPAACACQVVIEDGVSPLTPEQFSGFVDEHPASK
jgi:hypothetical protein